MLARAAEDLAARFAGVFCLPTVQRCLAARVHSHLPVLAILSGGRRGSHPPAPTDPGVTVSRYPALVILVIRQWGAC